ncbi:hypothetical protein DXG01_009926 [Tephrocybe rancida]|nr:hypothetical protein DXG01_009926 [Tephrocybe rancida]
MHFHILGLGPIGNLVSFHLRRALPRHHAITLIHRTQSQANDSLAHGGIIRIENQGIITTADGFGSEVFEANMPATLSAQETGRASGADIIDSLFITTKAHGTIPAVRRLLPRLSSSSTIVLMHNGMGVYEELVHDIFRNPELRPHFILSSNTHGAYRKGTKHFVHAGVGNITFGIVPDTTERNFEAGNDPNIPQIERRLRLADITPPTSDPLFKRYVNLRDTVAALLLMEPLNVSWLPMSEVQTAMRRKLVANAVINPLTAVMGCRNGDIFTTEAANRIAKRICQEASDAFAAEFRSDSKEWLDNLASQGGNIENVPVGRFPRALVTRALEVEVRRVAKATKGNISSMLADVRRGRSTEVEFINGYLLKLGSKYRVPMPATATMLNLVKMRSAIPIDQIL